ncbi:MAG: ATP-dependent helicase [Nanobdellota archaeon]
MIERMNNPYTEEKTSNILNPLVKKWFYKKFPSFCLPQKYGVLPIHSRENILISSPTGSGKTLTGFLSILNELVDNAQKGILEDKVYSIYISPLKALGYDIKENLLKPLEEIEETAGLKKGELGIRVGVRTGDTSQYERQKMTKKPPHILITTPESIALMLISPRFRENLDNLQWVIIDEIHAMAENKRGVHLSLMMEQLQHLNPGLTRVGLSATVSPLDKIAEFLTGPDRNCKVVDVSSIKKVDLKVISPVNDLINTDYKNIQKKMYDKMHELIQQHKTTLIFTNTRAATERIVHNLKNIFPKSYHETSEKPSEKYSSLIGAHHGSLSKNHRLDIEQRLRDGKLRVGVCSTSLELGIDIGDIDLVILLGSPKSVARALQRAGRANHQLNAITKARIIVMDRDDLVECSVLMKNAIEHKIDSVHIPENSYDILVQHILGFVLNERIKADELYNMTKKSYCYRNLDYKDFMQVVKYLSGDISSLENRNIFAKIFFNEDGTLGKRGKLTRMIYASNLGTIPSSSGILVKSGEYPLGTIDESFLERLKKGDRFVLGGDVYEFRYARGMSAQVVSASGKSPTIPRWVSETLPLSYDLSNDIQRFREYFFDKRKEMNEKEIIEWIKEYLYVDDITSEAIFNYMNEEYLFTVNGKDLFPKRSQIVIENFIDDFNHKGKSKKHYLIFHSLNGRKVNEALSRVFAYSLSKYHHKSIEIGLNDNGFYLLSTSNLDVKRVIDLVDKEEFKELLKNSIDNTEIVRRRFRHCAERSLMILRNYKGNVKNAGKQQVSSMILLKAAKKIGENFILLRETYREVMEDAMEIENAYEVFERIKEGSVKIKTFETSIPSPFATNLVLQGYSDIISIDDRHKFLQNMHKMVMAKISKKDDSNNIKDKNKKDNKPINYEKFWEKQRKDNEKRQRDENFLLVKDFTVAFRKKKTPPDIREQVFESLDNKRKDLKEKAIQYFSEEFKGTIDSVWTDRIISYVKEKMKSA